MAANDFFEDYNTGLAAPAEGGAEVTPDDGADLAHVSRALYVGTGGSLRLTLKSGAVVTLAGVVSGTILPLRACRVWAGGTTAADIVALW